jgi:predicted O-methyltransferase YrrM
MDFLDPSLIKYIESHTTPEPAVLRELNRETYAHVLKAHMLSGHVQGRLLSFFSHMIRPKAVLEIGTFTGYSALCLAEGLQAGGKVFTLDINEELEDMVRAYFAKASIEDKVEYIIGNAIDIIPTLAHTFDLVFIDADKKNYGCYYDLVFDKVRSGGFIIADNVLWKGRVVSQKIDSDTQIILDFNAKVQQDTRVENILLPVRDGLMVVRKK